MSIKDELVRLTGVSGNSIGDVLDSVDSLGGGGSGLKSIDVHLDLVWDEERGDYVKNVATASGMSYADIEELVDGETVIMTIDKVYNEGPDDGVHRNYKCVVTKMMVSARPGLGHVMLGWNPRDVMLVVSYEIYSFEQSETGDAIIYSVFTP